MPPCVGMWEATVRAECNWATRRSGVRNSRFYTLMKERESRVRTLPSV